MILKFTARVKQDANAEYVLHAFDAEDRRVHVLVSGEVQEDFGLEQARKKAVEKHLAKRFEPATLGNPRAVFVRYGDFGNE